MTSVEKRRSGRKSGGHRKHSDGGYSDTSSGGSFLDETDREVSNLTDRAFRSLCIGDEAVYNDSDLCSSSPCTQRDRQLAFSHSSQDRDGEDRDREELKRAAHDSFSLRMQQYGQEWIHGGMYGAEIHRDPQWGVYGEKTQGRVSATFQRSFMEMSQQEKSLNEEQLSFFSNGATELSSQQRRSRSRVSSLIRAFNSEGQRDGAGMDGKLRDCNDETSWDKSALMSIQRELSEFSTSYQQNFDSGHFPPAGPFSSRDNFYSSEVAAVAHMNAASSFMRSSHSKHSMLTQVNCNSNFFIHSEFSPFRVWRDHNRFPFQQGEVSGFMHCSEFPKWCKTPMYKELSLEAQPQGPSMFEERGIRHQRNTLAPMVPPTPSRSTSASTMLQKASSVEKRCESELAGHYPQRTRTQSLGSNRLPSQRPSTASPTIEMSRRVRDTISSVKALQQKIKMMTEQNIAAEVTANKEEVLYSNNSLIPIGNNAVTAAPKVHALQETSEVQQCAVPPQPVEHPPVRAGSRGATPDVRMSSYKSKATSLLFNLKDNRKRVKSTYSPTKFKGLETLEKNKQPAVQEHRDIVIDIPEFPDPDIQIPQVDVSNWTDEASHHHVNQYQRPGQSLTTMHSQPATAYTGQNLEYISSEYQAAQMQGEMVHHSGFTSYIPENDSSNQLPNGQNLHEDLSSFTPYKQSMIENIETLGGDVYRHKPSYRATEMPRLNAENNQIREYVIGKGNTQQHFNEAVGREYTKVDRYQQLKENKHDYSNVSSQDRWRQTNNQDTEKLSLNAATSPWKQDISALMEKDQHAQNFQKTATIKEELSSPRDKHIRENTQSINKELKQIPQNPAYHGQQQHGAFKDKYTLQKYHGQNVENEVKENYLTPNYSYNDQEHRNKHTFYSDEEKTVFMQETSQKKQYSPILKDQSLQSKEGKQLFEHNMQKNSLSVPDKALEPTAANQVKNRQFVEVKAAEDAAEQIKAVCTQAELEKAQHWAQVEQPKTEQAKVILACQTSLEKVKEELTEQDSIKQAKAEFNVADKAHVEHNEEEQRRKKQTEQSGGKKPEQAREEHLKEEQTRVQNVTEVPRNVTEEAGAEHTRQEQSERVKAEQADAERLKEEHIKTELAKSKQPVQARTEQAKTQLAQQERIKSEQLEMETEQVKVKAELAEAEHKKTEQAQLQQMKLQQANAGQEETKAAGGNVKAEHNVEKVREKKAEEDSVQADQVNAEQPKTETGKEANIKQAKLEQTKVELAKELIKTQKIQEWSAKSTAKITMSQKVKSEPSRVEQVKTELAKAKAELAKIKEKMKGEQKEKIMSTVITKEDDTAKKDVSFRADINENEEQDPATKINQQKKDSVVSRNSKDGGADDYQSLREKYGLTNAVSTHRNKVSPARNVSSNDDCVTSALALDKVETLNNKTSKDEYNPTSKRATPKTENKENVGNIKSNEVTESNYIYTESSKEFKLSSVNYSPTGVDKRTKSDTVTDKVKDGVDRLGKGEPVKQADVSQQRSGLGKPLERKPRSSEHSVFSGVTPPKALYHKERAQTKQEILTSKIKAHAEKEISAIKEKGFALRDGFTSKNSTKHLLGSQSINIRQRPPSQEVSRRHESTMPNNTTPKHQMGTAGIQMEPVKSISLSSTAATTSQILDVSQKHVPNETIKSIDIPEAQPTGSTATSTDGGLIENQKKEDQSGIKSPTQNKDGALDNKEKQEVKHEENSEGLMSKIAINTEQLNKKKEDPSQATSKHEVTPEDSSPAVKLVFGQNETSVADDSLQIMGIMVTVRERMGNSPADVSTQKQTHAKDHSNAKPDKCHHSLGVEVNKENEYSAGVSTGEAKDRVAEESHPTVNKDKVGMNNHPENMQETSTRINNVTEKRTTPQQESYIHARPQREIQLQEPLTENEAPPMVTVPAKNKVLAETQPCFYKQNIITREKKDHTNETPRQNSANIMTKDQEGINTEEKNPQTTLTDDVNKTFKPKLVNTGIDYKDDFNRVDAETRIKHDVQPSVKNDMTTVINPSKSSNIDDKSAPLVEEKRHDSTRLKSFSKTSPSSQLDENEIRHVPSKHQHKETHIKESNKVDSDVHIDSIAIRVVPAVIEKDNLEVMGKQITAVPSDAVAANEHKQVESSSPDETVSTANKEDESKDSTPTNSEEQVKDNLEGKLGVQYVLTSVRKLADSLKISNHQSSKKATTEIEQKIGTTSNTQPVEGDYFQVQGVIETNDEPYNSTNVRDRSDAVSKRGELPGLPNMTTISNESYKKGKHEVFALDQSKSKTVEPCPVSIQNENIKKDNREIEDKNASKPTNYPTETQSSKCENMDTGQAIPIRTHYPERKKRNSQPTRENAAKEKPEVQPKPKERVSTIPEISALADYARLKVIVSQETANTMQEFPPSKKEGFFPLIQSRHSRRPVFTADPQDLSMKEKSLSNKTEVSPKVIKEPKPVVFPITEKEHQRTGMFKLGDKERQEKILLDVKDNDGVLETVAKHAQDLAERKKSPQEHIKNEGNREEIAGAGTQRVSQVDQNVHQSNNHPMQTTTSSSSVNKPRNTVLQHLNPREKTEFSSADGMTNLDRDSQIYSMKESKTNLRKGEDNEDKDTVAGEDRTDKPRQESLTIPYKETGVKPQSRAKQLDETLGLTEEKKREELRIKNIIEESRASLAEEERRAAQREVERRARERETIAIKIKERREKQKEAERRAEEERKAKQAEEERAAQKEEEGRRARQREEEMKMKEFEEKRRAKIEEERKAKLRVEEERMKAIEERRRVKQREEERAALIEEQRRAKQVEEEKRLAHIEEERKRKKSEEERAAQEEQQRRAALIEEQWRKAKQVEEERRLAYIEEERKRKSSEEKAAQITEEKMIKQIQEQRRERQKKEWLRTQTEEERRAVDKEKAILKQKEEQQAKEERARLLEEANQAAQREEKRIAQEQLQAQREEEIRAKKREEAKIAAEREQERASRVEEQKRAAQRMDALQYYAITSTESERKPRERQLPSPIPCQQRNNTSESTADFGSYSRSHRPHAPASPAPSLPRSNTSSPALGAKPLMFRVKDNTIRGSSFTKSVKPRFHKNFGEDFRVGSPMERGDEEQEIVRRNTGTPIHPDTATRHTAIKESSNLQPTSSSQDYSVPLPHHRPYSRRSIILDEDESRSVFSNMSEDVESFVTSTTDLADVRGLYDYERPESACSFSSELSRLGKPPVVPPKSEKALLRAKRLTTRRIKKELSKAGADIPAKKSLKEVSSIPSSSSSEVCSSNRHAVASPHFSPPVSLTNAPLRSSLLSSHTEQQPLHRSFHGSPHATTPVSLPVASPHATGPVSLPVASPHATGSVSLPVASPHATDPVSFPVASPHATGPVSFPVASPHATGPVSLPVASPHATGSVSLPVASPHATGPVSLPVASPHATGPVSLPVASPHVTGPVSLPVASPHATGPVSLPVASPHVTGPVSHSIAPKTVAHVPSSPTLHHANHPAPVTQYHVESSYPQSYPLTQRKVLQDLGSGQYFVVDVPVQVKTKTFFDPETGKYVQLNVRESGQSTTQPQSQQTYPQPQLQPQMQVKQQQQPLSQASPAGKPFVVYQGYHGYPQSAGISSVHPQSSSSGMSAPMTPSQDQLPGGHRYSPEKTPYMDTVNDKDKTHNTGYNTHGLYECDSQLAGSLVCDNNSSAHSRYQSRDIITMGDLEDFMEVSDW